MKGSVFFNHILQRPLRVLFMGSDILSCPYLSTLIESPEIEVAAVLTQIDKKKGRGLKVEMGPVKKIALGHDIPVFTPVHIKGNDEIVDTIAGLGIDVIVVMAYGQILPDLILSLPPLGCVNLHVSLLPRWRGAAPIQYAILNGDEETGVTAMMMNREMDKGDILGQVKCAIDPKDTAKEVGEKLTQPGCDLMISVLRQLAQGNCPRIPQGDSPTPHARKIKAADTSLDWTQSALQNERRIRALSPKPGAATFIPGVNGKPGFRLKVMEAEVETLPRGVALAVPGTLLEMDVKRGPLVAGGAGKALRLLKVQPEGGNKPLTGSEFANGYRSRIPISIRFENLPPPPPKPAVSSCCAQPG